VVLSLLMLLATGYGVLQLAVLGWATRSVRFVTLLRAVAVGFFACGFVALLLQLAATAAISGMTGLGWAEAVRLAGATIDPWIEEIVKVAPIVLIVLAARRLRQQWGLTDYFLVGAAIGAGFTLAESMLRFAHRAGSAIAGADGYTLPIGLTPPVVPGLGRILTSWLPAPVAGYELLGPGEVLDLHLAWTALAAAGLGYCLRGRPGRGGGWFRPLGIIPLVYVGTDHAAHNYLGLHPDPAGPTGWFARLLGLLHELLPGLVLLALIVVVAVDLLDLRRVRADHPELLLDGERTGSRALALLRRALVAPPLSTWVVGRMLLIRRSLWYETAAGGRPSKQNTPPQGEPELAAELVHAVRQLDRVPKGRRWWTVARDLGRQLIGDPRRHDAKTLLRRGWPVPLWLLLVLPVLLYLGLGTIPQLAGIQDLLASPYGFPVVGVLAVPGVLFLGWQLARAVPRLLQAGRQPWIDQAGQAWSRGLICVAAIAAGLAGLLRWLTGAAGADRLHGTAHLLDALGDAQLAAGLMLALSALFLVPPVTVVAVAGGGFRLRVPVPALAPISPVGPGPALAAAGTLLSAVTDPAGAGGGAARQRRLEELAQGGSTQDGADGATEQGLRRAEAILGLEEAGLVQGIRSDPDDGADFIDGDGTRWAVRELGAELSARSGNDALDQATESIAGTLRVGVNVVLRRDAVTDDTAEELARRIAAVPEWQGRVHLWP
jgi:RsiW-degrading membrane proteinase PrsW (M82 family)